MKMKMVVLLLFIDLVAMVDVHAQKTMREYVDSFTDQVVVKASASQVNREIKKCLKTEKQAGVSGITVYKEQHHGTMKGAHITNFTFTPKQKVYAFDCFPLPQNGRSGDELWVKVNLDTSNFHQRMHQFGSMNLPKMALHSVKSELSVLPIQPTLKHIVKTKKLCVGLLTLRLG